MTNLSGQEQLASRCQLRPRAVLIIRSSQKALRLAHGMAGLAVSSILAVHAAPGNPLRTSNCNSFSTSYSTRRIVDVPWSISKYAARGSPSYESPTLPVLISIRTRPLRFRIEAQ
jgi:hypothetical protein